MKIKYLVLFLLAVPVLLFASGIQNAHKQVLARQTIASGGCTSGATSIGDDAGTGAGTRNSQNTWVYFFQYAATDSCTIDELAISFADTNAGGYLRMALYADSSDVPTGDPLTQSAETAIPGSDQDIDVSVSVTGQAITNTTDYWIAVMASYEASFYHNGVAGLSYYMLSSYHSTNDFPTVSSPQAWTRIGVVYGVNQ